MGWALHPTVPCDSGSATSSDAVDLLIAVKLDPSEVGLEVTFTLQVSNIRKLPDFSLFCPFHLFC